MDSCLISGVLRSTTARIGSLIVDSPTLLPSAVLDDLKKLESVTLAIYAAIDGSEGLSGGDQEAERVWLSEVKEIAYRADDVLAECGYEVLQAAVRHMNETPSPGLRPDSIKGYITSLASYPGTIPVISAYLSGRLREVIMKFEQISSKQPAVKFGNKLSHQVYLMTGVDSGTSTPLAISLVNESCIFGREQEKEKITEFLLSTDPNTDNVSVLAIVGQAGVGKTTLAQLVYNDPIICRNFELRGWVNVSDVFSITNITQNILQSFRKKECFLKDQTPLQKELVRELTGKRFFIVLDGLYHENKSHWERFLAPFLYAQSGKIIITTRSASTAEIVQTMPQFNLKSLTFEDSWSIFEKSAFRSLDVGSRCNALEAGRRIVAKFGGIPLVVKTVASALKFENNEQKWVRVLELDLHDSSSSSEAIYAPLRICYNCMPDMLKQCFLFLAMYPNGHVFYKDHLIRLWISVDLLQEEGIERIDVGYLVFSELIERAVFEPAHGVYGRNNGFVVHGSMHDLARSVAGKEFAIVKHDCLHDIVMDVRYLSIVVPCFSENVDLQSLKKCMHLRVLQILNQENTWKCGDVNIEIPNDLFEQLKYLRSLIIRDTNLETLPDSISNLKLLRFLDLTNTCIGRLPQSISHLYYLEVLELTNCPLKELPEGIKNMVSLQILDFQNSFSLCMPRGIGNLIKLRTLPRFDVKRGSCHCALSELKNLVDLKGGLFIGGLSHLTRVEEAMEANLQNKENLEALTLDWSHEPSPNCSHSTELSCTSTVNQGLIPDINSANQVLEYLRPPANLVELHINEYHGSRFPSWLDDPSFTRLVKISLIGNQDECRVLPKLGQLRYLRNLSIQYMPKISRVGSQFSSGVEGINGFRLLETLEFCGMLNWTEWSGVKNGEFCSLRALKLVDCPQLRFLPGPLSSSLTELLITDSGMLSRIPMLPSLRSLSLSGDVSQNMFNFLHLPLLRTLKVCQSRNVRLLRLNNVKLPSLLRLIIHGCRNLRSIVGISALNALNFFKISACPNLQISLKEILPQTLRHLSISNCPKLLSWKKIQDVNIKYYAQLKMDGEINNKVLELPDATQANIESADSKQHVSENLIENDPAYKSKDLIDEDEYFEQLQVQSPISAKDLKGKQHAELSDSETWSNDSV